MKFHVENYITIEEMQLLCILITALEDDVEDRHIGTSVNCHEVAQAVVETFGKVHKLRRIAGHYADLIDHSWCLNQRGIIFDVYPVGVYPAPILVDGTAMHARRIYVEHEVQSAFDPHIRPTVVQYISRQLIYSAARYALPDFRRRR